MDPQSQCSHHPLFSLRVALVAVFIMAGGGSAMAWFYNQESQQPKETLAAAPNESAEELITLPRSTWKAARLELGSPERRQLSHTVRVTGKIALNEDRVAHIYPLVTGRVQSVPVQFGQKVAAGDTLVIVESPEVGNAKLSLYKNRLLHQFAKAKDDWTQEIAKNSQKLVAELRNEPPLDVLTEKFQNLTLGASRETLVTAYANLKKTRADHERLESLSREGVTSGKQLIAARAQHATDLVTFKALLETVDQEQRHAALLSSQTVEEAASRVAVDEASLHILGFRDQDLTKIDPTTEGETLSQYPIRAPFDGTVIHKDVVLMERVDPEHQILTVADLSTVWVEAAIFEQHLPQLANLDQQTINFTTTSWDETQFQAQVFHTGAIVEEATRAIALRATADNRDGRLKPGMFIEIELPGANSANNLAVPRSAIQEHGGEIFVFVHRGEDNFERRPVELGMRSGDWQEITSGLSSKETLAVRGGFAIKSRMLAAMLEED